MESSRIRMSHPYGQTPPNIFTDTDWVRRHEKELLERYGERAIIVYQEQVIGVGDSLQTALEDAEQNLPPNLGEITPIHEWLGYRHPFLRALPGNFEPDPNSGADDVDSRLRSAGLLLDVNLIEDVAELTPEERRRIGQLFVGERSSEELIDEERDN